MINTHAWCHSVATQLLKAGDDMWTVQELLGHWDVSTTMILTHVPNRGDKCAKLPLDSLIRRSVSMLSQDRYSLMNTRVIAEL